MQLGFRRQAAAASDDSRFGENAFVSLIRRIGVEQTSAELWPQMLAHIIVATTSHAVRDAAALSLIDCGGRNYTEALVEAIRRPDLVGHKGTLLFALDELGGALSLEVLVQLIEQKSYEAIAEALLFFEMGRIVVPSDAAANQSLRERLRTLQSATDATVSEAASMALAQAWS